MSKTFLIESGLRHNYSFSPYNRIDRKVSRMNYPKFRLVVFDCDGVLVDGHTSFFVAKELGIESEIKRVYRDVLIGSKTFSQAVDESLKLFIGIKEEDVRPILMSIPLIKGVEETIKAIKKGGIKVGTISTGGSKYFVDILKKRLDLDFAIGTGIKIKEGVFVGLIEPIIDMANKEFHITKMVESYGFNLKDCVAVGDDISNLTLFKKVGLSISFNLDCLRREIQFFDLSVGNKILSYIKLVLAEFRVKRGSQISISEKNLKLLLPHLGIH
jgi:phosphoserine phosphatase SerB